VSVLVCWSDDGRGKICGGRMRWRVSPSGYSGTCSRCSLQTRAASGEVRELDALPVERLDPDPHPVIETSKPRGVRPGVDLGESRDTTPHNTERGSDAR